MKRAAGQIRKVRRNKSGKDAGSFDVANDYHNDQVHHPVKRKPTAEEAALTAKNYRLAKELSDLRVRHREENKTVSRLTTENMNLATRWREAINHIAALKKELAIQQYRAAEAIAQQKQLQMALSSGSPQSNESSPKKQPRPSTLDLLGEANQSHQKNQNISFQDVALEMDRMDQILAAHQSKSRSDSQTSSPPIPKDPSFEESTSEEKSPSPAIGNHSNDLLVQSAESDGEEKKTQSMDQPVTPSPEKENNLSFEDEDEDAEFEHNNEHGVNFFAPFKAPSTPVDLDELDDQLDEDELFPDHSPVGSDASSESPPPSPTLQTVSPSSAFQDEVTIPEDNGDDEAETIKQTAAALFPMTASPVLSPKPKVVVDESFPPDITAKHPRSADRRTPPYFKDIDEEEDDCGNAPSASLESFLPPPPPLASMSSKPPQLQPILSSAEAAFEQSFHTEFPPSFSPSAEAYKLGGQEQVNDGFHPFFPSPIKESVNENAKYFKSQGDAGILRRGQADIAPSPVYANRPTRSFSNAMLQHDYTAPTPTANPPNTATPDQMIRALSNDDHNVQITNASTSIPAVRYQTPPHPSRSPESLESKPEGPKRPEKAGAAAARARYEKALQPRGFTGGSRRFPRRAEREGERGASPVFNLSAFAAEIKSNASGLIINTTMSAAKERASAITERTIVPVHEGMVKSSSLRDHQWVPRPSPTDSVSSKPWDEEIGDIPLTASSSSNRRNEQTVASAPTGHHANGIAGYSSSSPSNNSVRSSYRRLLERNRPWDIAIKKQEAEFSVDPAGFSVHQDDVPNNNIDSPTSRFIAAGKSRRQVRQPITYAEPSLNSKIRQGHDFFPKQDPNTRTPPDAVHL